jgi:serine/threonine protein kinase
MKLQESEIVGPYTVVRELGLGGMSHVYLARDNRLCRDVVLKFPNEDLMGDPASYERFQREIKIGKLLDHPNIQKLFELAGDTEKPCLVLEYVPGETLRDDLRHDGPKWSDPVQAQKRALSIGVQISNALAYTHEHGVFHRDLKPENIIITPDGVPKVMDFGIAFLEGTRRITWGALSSQVGTPDYMAPEQIKGQRGDDRTDIYALGMILYECVTGRLPYQGDNALAVMNQHVTASPPPMRQFARQVSPALDEVILKAIRRNPDARWQSARAFVAALEGVDQVDVAVLKAEREEQETDHGGSNSIHAELGMPLWKVGLLVSVILISLIALTLVIQFFHPAH